MSKPLQYDLVYTDGNALVPSKALSYKQDEQGKVVSELIKPNTIRFENSLKDSLKKNLGENKIFPTAKDVFVSIVHGLNSEAEYKKCDLDNRAKCILDALKTVIYQDDAQVKILWTEKIFLKNEQTSYYRIGVKILTVDSYKQLSLLKNKIID